MTIAAAGHRLLTTALALAAAIWVGRAAAVAALSAPNPVLALRIDHNAAAAVVANSDRLLRLGPEQIDRALLARDARRALRTDPLNAAALRQLGFAADLGKDHARARQLVQLSERVSRRDLAAHVWWIEDRVAAGDVAGALRHYDLALTVSNEAPALLYPVLASALNSADVRRDFAPYLGRGRAWMPGLLNEAISSGVDPRGLADMIIGRGGLPADAAYRSLGPQLLDQLVIKGFYPEARRFFLSLPGATAPMLNEAGFNDRTTDPARMPLAWQLSSQSEARAARGDHDDVIIQADADERGVVARRTFLLTQGRYAILHAFAPLPEMSAATAIWELRCRTAAGSAASSASIWRREMAGPATAATERATFVVPSGCPAQELTLTVLGGDEQASSGLRIGPIALWPAPSSGASVSGAIDPRLPR